MFDLTQSEYKNYKIVEITIPSDQRIPPLLRHYIETTNIFMLVIDATDLNSIKFSKELLDWALPFF